MLQDLHSHTYYSFCGKDDPEEIVKSIKPWYDGYCFAKKKIGEECVFNSDMTLYHLKHLVAKGEPPENMVDANIRTDYDKLKADYDDLKEEMLVAHINS